MASTVRAVLRLPGLLRAVRPVRKVLRPDRRQVAPVRLTTTVLRLVLRIVAVRLVRAVLLTVAVQAAPIAADPPVLQEALRTEVPALQEVLRSAEAQAVRQAGLPSVEEDALREAVIAVHVADNLYHHEITAIYCS